MNLSRRHTALAVASRPRPAKLVVVLVTVGLLQAGCSAQRRYENPKPGFVERGIASWYGEKFHGRPTANGETYDMHGLTAAHKELPLGTVIDVKNLDNGRTVRVRINDRGPFVRGRILDLSLGAARELAMENAGLAKVEIRVAKVGQGRPGMSQVEAFAVQAGAFRNRDNALDLRHRLADKFPTVEIRTSGDLHRVWVGHFDDRREAEKLRAQLRGMGVDAVLVEQ